MSFKKVVTAKLSKLLLRIQSVGVKRLSLCLAIFFCALFIIAGSLVSLNRYWQYESFYYDFGIFDQAIWRVAHFTPPIIDHLVVGGKWIFADHFNPSIFLLSPLYWITDRREILLFAQALIVGLSGFVLYLIAQKVIKNSFYSLAVLICYLLFIGLQNAVITDLHEITLATLPFMLAYLAILNKKIKWYFLFLLITLGFKESNFLLCFGIGISIFFINRSWLKIAIITCGISLLWGFISIHYIIPFFSGGIYQYGVNMTYNPIAIVGTLFDNKIKIHTLFYSFLSFGFLPLLSFQFWFLLFQDFLTRFYSPLWFTRWDLGLHYSSLTAAIMGVSSVYSIRLLQKIIPTRILKIAIVLLILNAVFLYRFILHAPFGLSYNPALYTHTKDFKFLDSLITKIPINATVMAQNNLAVRFTHQNVWTMESDANNLKPDYYVQKKPQYVVLDLRPGQNPNDLFLIKDSNVLLQELNADHNYMLFYHAVDQYIFRRR